MAKYDKETKFYWLQLKEDFFEDDAIEWLEEQKPNGRDYAYFYLKLCLKALKSNGILIRQVGNILIPYDNRKLAELTKMDFDTVTVAMELLKQIGLVEILENGEIYITQLENLIGSVSKGALRKQQQRLLKMSEGGQMGGQMSTKDKDKVKDKDKNIDINNMSIIYNWEDNEICECITNSNEKCLRRSSYKINGKNHCNQHSKPIIGYLYDEENQKKFKKPTLEELGDYKLERNSNVDVLKFYNYYEANGWRVGKNPMKDWKATFRYWETNENKKPNNEDLPSWYGKEIKKQTITTEEREELENMLKEFEE